MALACECLQRVGQQQHDQGAVYFLSCTCAPASQPHASSSQQPLSPSQDRLDSSAPYGQGTVPCCAVSDPLGVCVPVLKVYVGCGCVGREGGWAHSSFPEFVWEQGTRLPSNRLILKDPFPKICLSCRAGLQLFQK